jgi:starch synthase
MASKSLKVLFVCAEVAPFSSVGGLSQVAHALSRELKRLGVDIRIFTPKYGVVDSVKYPTKTIINDLKVPCGDDKFINSSVESYQLSKTEVPIYFLANEEYYQKRANVYNYSDDHVRFGLLSKAAIEFIKSGVFVPDVIHANDWHTGYLIDFLKNSEEYKNDPVLKKVATILSIHNIYQGVFDFTNASEMDHDDGKSPLESLFSDKLIKQNSLKRGVMYADLVNTVSQTYVQELLNAEYGGGLENLFRELRGKLYGVLNGLDVEEFNPATDEIIKQKFSAKSIDLRPENKLDLQKRFNLENDPDVPLIAYSGRLDQQKGLDLLLKEFEYIVNDLGAQVIVLGGGERSYVEFFSEMEKRHPGRVGTHLMRDFTLPRKIFAGADMILIPSKYEPGGIIAIEALRYGCIPIVRATGGLADSVINYDPKSDSGYGFTFKQFSPEGLLTGIIRAIETYKNQAVWKRMVKRAMQLDFSWKKSALKYIELYKQVIEQHTNNVSPKTPADRPLYS